MEDIKKEIAELKELVSKLLEMEIKKYKMQYDVPHDGLVKRNGKLIRISGKFNST